MTPSPSTPGVRRGERTRARAARLPAAPVVLLAGLALTVTGCSSDAGTRQEGVEGTPEAAVSDVSLRETAAEVRRDVAAVWPRTGRIWPGADFTGHVVLLTDGRQAWAVDKDSRRKVPLKELARQDIDVPTPDGFDPVTWQGRKALIVRPPSGRAAQQLRQDPTGLTPGDVPTYAFALATHEQFHPNVQHAGERGAWPSLKAMEKRGSGSREELYPLQSRPRLLRAMVYNSLLAAYEQPERRAKHLSAAAYWHRKWSEAYPGERKSQALIDLLEGTTKYVEVKAVAMAQVKDPGNAEQVRNYLVRTLRPMKVASKDLEPYAIGAVALLNAEVMGRKSVRQTLMRQPVTPASLLLRGVKPVAQRAPREVKEGIRRSVAERNRELSRTIEPFVKKVQDPGGRVLMLPVKAVRGSMGGEGFYTTRELPVSIMPEARATFRLKTGKVTLDGVTTGELEQNGRGYFAVPLDPDDEDVSLEGDTLTLTGRNLSGTVTVTSRTDEGQRFLYAQ